MAVTFRWINNNKDVEVRSINGNYLYTYHQARDAYRGPDGSVVIITNTLSPVRIDSNGCRHFG